MVCVFVSDTELDITLQHVCQGQVATATLK
jgi:hypothetical protein